MSRLIRSALFMQIYRIVGLTLVLGWLVLPAIVGGNAHGDRVPASKAKAMIDIHATEARLRDHLKTLTIDIGERNVLAPENLKKRRTISEITIGG